MCTVVYAMLGGVARTNIDIDDELLTKVMEFYEFRTKKEAVEAGLVALLGGRPMTLEEALAMRGTGWEGDLDELRDGDPTDWPAAG